MIDINLLPWREMLRQKQRKQKMLAIIAYTAIFLIVAIGIHVTYSIKVSHLAKRNQKITQQINAAQTEISTMEKRVKLVDLMKSRMATLNDLDYNRYFTVKLFSELAEITPNGVSFKKMERKGNKMVLTGIANSHDSVAEFVAAIKQSPIFSSPVLEEVSVQQSGAESIIEFNLTVTLIVPIDQKENDHNEKESGKK